MITDRTRTVIIGVVTAVWALNFTAGLVVADYKPSESINGIFMAIVGGLFAIGARNGQAKKEGENGGNGDGGSSKPLEEGKSPGDGDK